MSIDSPRSHSAPESNENFSKPGEVERNWDMTHGLTSLRISRPQKIHHDQRNPQANSSKHHPPETFFLIQHHEHHPT